MRLKENPMIQRHSMAVYGGAVLAIALGSVAVIAQRADKEDVGLVPDRNAAPSHQILEDRRPGPPTNLTVE